MSVSSYIYILIINIIIGSTSVCVHGRGKGAKLQLNVLDGTVAKSFLFAAGWIKRAGLLYVHPKRTNLFASVISVLISKYINSSKPLD